MEGGALALLLVLGAVGIAAGQQVCPQWEVPAGPPTLCPSAALLLCPACMQAPVCNSYISKGLMQPASGVLNDVILVNDAFEAGDASVTLDVSFRRVGALEVRPG